MQCLKASKPEDDPIYLFVIKKSQKGSC